MAQETMSLRECMEYAINNSTTIRIEATNRNDEQIARREAILNAFTPTIEGGTYAYNNYGRTIDPETNTYVNTTSFNNGYSLNTALTIFDGFKALNNIRVRNTMMKMGLSKQEIAENEICLATMQAYFNVIYYKKLSEIIENQVKTSEETLFLIKKQEEIGQKSQSDVIQIEADLAEKQYTFIKTKNLYEDALITLKDVMFYPIDKELIIDENIIHSDNNSATAANIAEFAKESNAQALIAKNNMDNAMIELKTSRWQLAPKLSLYAGWSTSYYSYPGSSTLITPPFQNQFSNNMGEYIQLSLSIPIYNRLYATSNIKRKKNEYLRASAEYDKKIKEIENEVYRAVNDRDGAKAAYNQAQLFAMTQKESFALNTRKLEQGIISSIEYQTASGKYLEAMASALNAEFQYIIKSALVRYYNGESYIDQF
ncbi:MAG: TolC family protein [Candidatus Limimorpha sp.]